MLSKEVGPVNSLSVAEIPQEWDVGNRHFINELKHIDKDLGFICFESRLPIIGDTYIEGFVSESNKSGDHYVEYDAEKRITLSRTLFESRYSDFPDMFSISFGQFGRVQSKNSIFVENLAHINYSRSRNNETLLLSAIFLGTYFHPLLQNTDSPKIVFTKEHSEWIKSESAYQYGEWSLGLNKPYYETEDDNWTAKKIQEGDKFSLEIGHEVDKDKSFNLSFNDDGQALWITLTDGKSGLRKIVEAPLNIPSGVVSSVFTRGSYKKDETGLYDVAWTRASDKIGARLWFPQGPSNLLSNF